MTSKIEAHDRTVGEIFSDLYVFEIPPYQRPYAWEEDQIRELLNDVLDAMDNQAVSGGLYFLGSIVLVKSPASPQSMVIDGQQRLTTLTILLGALRDLTTDPETRFERRQYIYQKASADRGLKERYRLLLREQDRPFFLQHVQGAGATDILPDPSKLDGSQKRIAENVRYLRSRLETLTEARRNDLTAFIIQRCYLVVVAVPTAEAARRIFTVLNARGLDLEATDILKADLLERADHALERPLAIRWERIEQALSRERMVELFGHIRMIYERDKPRQALEAGFRKLVPPFAGNAEKFLSDVLEPCADTLLLMSDSVRVQKHFGAETAKAVRSLDRIDNKDWLPPALLRAWKSGPDDAAAAGQFLVDLERVAYFLFVTRAGINDRISRFAAIMDEFDPRPNKEPAGGALTLSDIEQHRFLAALSGPLYELTRVCKPVLLRLDEALSTGGASYDQLVSIEHVLPQTVEVGSEWAQLFSDELERSEWTHRIANLVLLTQRINVKASNWDFERKKHEYFASADGSSPFVITQGVLQADRWTSEHLRARQKRLLEKLCRVWRLDAVDVEEQLVDPSRQRGNWQFTDVKVIEAKRQAIIQAFSSRVGASLVKNGARYSSSDNEFRAVCTVSKRYTRRSAPYWYGYSDEWRKFLSEGKKSFLIFGCVDRSTAYAVPIIEIEKRVNDLHRTPDRHWHIVLDENDAGGLDLVPKTGPRMPLNKHVVVLV